MLARLKNEGGIGLFGCFLTGFCFAVWIASHKPPSEQRYKEANETQRHAEPIAPTAATDANMAHTDGDRHRSADEKKWFTDFFEIKLTDLLIAIFTGVLAWKTAGLFRETAGLRNAADKQQADLLRSIEAAEKSAEAAIGGNQLTREI